MNFMKFILAVSGHIFQCGIFSLMDTAFEPGSSLPIWFKVQFKNKL